MPIGITTPTASPRPLDHEERAVDCVTIDLRGGGVPLQEVADNVKSIKPATLVLLQAGKVLHVKKVFTLLQTLCYFPVYTSV